MILFESYFQMCTETNQHAWSMQLDQQFLLIKRQISFDSSYILLSREAAHLSARDNT